MEALLLRPGLRSKAGKQAHCFGAAVVLRIVKVETYDIEGEVLAVSHILCKELPELYIFYLSVTLPLRHIVECQKQIAVGTLDRILELSLDLYSAQRRESFSNCRNWIEWQFVPRTRESEE